MAHGRGISFQEGHPKRNSALQLAKVHVDAAQAQGAAWVQGSQACRWMLRVQERIAETKDYALTQG